MAWQSTRICTCRELWRYGGLSFSGNFKDINSELVIIPKFINLTLYNRFLLRPLQLEITLMLNSSMDTA